MSGRTSLVVGAQCPVLNRLSFLPRVARELAAVLADPALGGCVPALPEGPVLEDPASVELDAALERAFRDAAEREATLVLAFIGHGVIVDDDFYLMAADSPEVPNSRQALLLGQRVKELLRVYSSLDGLILLLDTCGSGLAAGAAGADWIDVLRSSGRRFELLTATGEGTASGGCFTKSLVYLLRTGRAQPVDRLGAAHLRGPISELCTEQAATWTGFDGSTPALGGDDALWIAVNTASSWRSSPLAGTAFADEARRLTAHYQPTPAFDTVRDLLTSGNRWIAVTGPAHTGKSTLVAALTRPDLTGVGAPDHLLHAAVFLGEESSPEQAAEAIGAQLAHTVPGFADAVTRFRDETTEQAWEAAGAWERHVLGPLRAQPDAATVRIAVDGNILAGMDPLFGPEVPARVQLLVTCRDADATPTVARVVELAPAANEELTGYARARGIPADAIPEFAAKSSGNWTIAALLADQLEREPRPSSAMSAELGATYHAALLRAGATAPTSPVAPVLAVLAAAGHPAVLPLPLLCHASGALGGPGSAPRVHEALARLDGLVTRSGAGTDAEHAGLVHKTVAAYLREHRIGEIPPERAHRALADAIAELAPRSRHRPSEPGHAYAARAEAEHLWHCGEFEAAVGAVDERNSVIPAENRARWAEWTQRIATDLGPDHPLTLRARARHARWTAEAGDKPAALEVFRRLRAESERKLGPDHRATLSIRDNIAFWTGLSDPPAGLREFTALVPDCTASLGPLDPQTLTARHHLALMHSKCGHHTEAIKLWQEILPLRERVVGSDHLDTQRTRHCILFESAENGHPPPHWIFLFELGCRPAPLVRGGSSRNSHGALPRGVVHRENRRTGSHRRRARGVPPSPPRGRTDLRHAQLASPQDPGTTGVLAAAPAAGLTAAAG